MAKNGQKWPKMAENRQNSRPNHLHSDPNRYNPTPIAFSTTIAGLFVHHPGIKPALLHRNLGASRGFPVRNGPLMGSKWVTQLVSQRHVVRGGSNNRPWGDFWPFLAIFGHFWPFLAIFAHFWAVFWPVLADTVLRDTYFYVK